MNSGQASSFPKSLTDPPLQVLSLPISLYRSLPIGRLLLSWIMILYFFFSMHLHCSSRSDRACCFVVEHNSVLFYPAFALQYQIDLVALLDYIIMFFL
jgi:hypothetical protein